MARYTIHFFSKSLLRKTEINVVIPSLSLSEAMKTQDPNVYQNSTEKFPLMICLSGFSEDSEAWLLNSNIMALCDKYRIAAVFVGGDNRWYLNSSPIDAYETFLKQELPDFIYGTFAKVDAGKKPILCGVSMGGYGALYNGTKNVDRFSAICAMSPATRPDPYIDESKFGTLKEHFMNAKGKLPPVWLSVGANDFIVQPSREFDAWLTENKIGFNYQIKEGYDHSWNYWKDEIVNVLNFFKEKNII